MSSCSGESTKNETPKIVSGLVVKTEILFFCSVSNKILTPEDLPIQFFCCSFIELGQSILFNPLNNRLAYAVILSDHCFIFFCSTG